MHQRPDGQSPGTRMIFQAKRRELPEGARVRRAKYDRKVYINDPRRRIAELARTTA